MAGFCRDMKLYSILLLASGFVTHLLNGGMAWAAGVFYVIFLDVLQYDSPPQVALGTALNGAMFHAVGPIAGVLVSRYGSRAIGMMGGLMTGGGLILTIFSVNVYYMCFTFGVVCGAGTGFVYMAATVCVANHMPKYRPLTYGVTSSSSGIGSFIYPLLISRLYGFYSWRGTLLIFGGMLFNIIACAAIFRPVPHSQKMKIENTTARDRDTQQGIFKLGIFRNVSYVCQCVCNMGVYCGMSVVTVHLGAYAISTGMNEDSAAFLYSIIGVSGILGRLGSSLVLQLPGCTGVHTFMVGFSAAGVATLLLPLAESMTGFYVYATMFGIFVGTHGVSNLEMCVQFLGQSNYAVGLGNLMLLLSIGQVAGGPVASVLYQSTGDYSVPLYFGGGVMVFGTAFLLVPLLKRSSRQTDEQNVNVEPALTDEVTKEKASPTVSLHDTGAVV